MKECWDCDAFFRYYSFRYHNLIAKEDSNTFAGNEIETNWRFGLEPYMNLFSGRRVDSLDRHFQVFKISQ